VRDWRLISIPDKSSLSNDARTNFADLFDKMNAFWELSDSKKTYKRHLFIDWPSKPFLKVRV